MSKNFLMSEVILKNKEIYECLRIGLLVKGYINKDTKIEDIWKIDNNTKFCVVTEEEV